MHKFLFVIISKYTFPKVQLLGWTEWDRREADWKFPSRVHSCGLRGPRFALWEPLFEWRLGWARCHAGSSSIGPCRVSLAPFTSVSWGLRWSTLIPGPRWIPRAVSVTTRTVMPPLVCGVSGLLVLWPVALSSSPVAWKHLQIKKVQCSRCSVMMMPGLFHFIMCFESISIMLGIQSHQPIQPVHFVIINIPPTNLAASHA